MCCWNNAEKAKKLLTQYYERIENSQNSNNSDDWEFIEYVPEDTPNANKINMKIFIENQERKSWAKGINYFR